jgi:lysyl-tRNA synthetase class 2
MRRVEEMVDAVARACDYNGEIDLTPPWRRVTLRDAILKQTGIDFRAHPDRDSLAAAIGDRLPTAGRTWPQLVDDQLSALVEPTLQQPTFVLDYPVELSPFAKAHRS